MDMINIVIDEIALNGLEGVTVPGLWDCLMKREPPLQVESDEKLKSFLWRGILQCSQVNFLWYNQDGKNRKPDEKKRSKKGAENSVKGTKKVLQGARGHGMGVANLITSVKFASTWMH